MTATAQKKLYECKHGCGYTHAHRGGMNIHESVHCKVLRGAAAAAVKPQKTYRYCDCDGEPVWQLLDSKDPWHARAIAEGYKKYCTGCGEVE